MKENLAHVITSRPEVNQPTAPETAYEIFSACNDAKGRDVAVLDVSHIFGLSDFFVVASARSDRQVQGIANRIIASMAELGVEPVTIEGLEQGHWVLIDFGDVVAHIFYEPLREHYDVEGLWMGGRRGPLARALDRPAAGRRRGAAGRASARVHQLTGPYAGAAARIRGGGRIVRSRRGEDR